jgi:hypothetical protein
VSQVPERCHSDFYNIPGPGEFLQRLQKLIKGCKSFPELPKTFQALEYFQKLFGTVSKVLKGRLSSK